MDQKKKVSRKEPAESSPPTLRSTSGAGFDFEDLVGAWLMLKMLLGDPLPAIGGQGQIFQAQVSALGWRIDDLLITARDDDKTRRLAMSIKGNVQVTGAGLPADFVQRAWAQWRDTESPMNRDSDGLALVTRSGHLPTFDPHWKELKDASLAAIPELGLARIRANRKQSIIFDSVRKATGGDDATDEEALALIRRLHVLPVDFQLAHSEREAESIGHCRRLLVSGSLAEAHNFWRDLVDTVRDVRLRRGTMTSTEILASFRRRYSLLDHPNFAADWRVLTNTSADYKARILTELPSGQVIERRDAIRKLEGSLREKGFVVVFGESGVGKSALTKEVLDQHFPDGRQVWLDPESLRIVLSAARRSILPLHSDLLSILQASGKPQNFLVLDSVERIEPEELPIVRKFLEDLLVDGDDTWRVAIITQTQGLREIAQVLAVGRNAQLVEVEPLSPQDVSAALGRIPTLAWLNGHNEAVAALTNLRALGWVVQAGRVQEGGILSYTAIADRLWQIWTKGRLGLQAMMMRLGEREAAFQRNFPLSEFDPGELELLDARPPELPLRIDSSSNRIEFEHDLAADWSRYQFLKQHSADLSRWAHLSTNPLWSSALRMLAQHLLRVAEGTTGTEWDRLRAEVDAAKLPQVGDILLDGLALDPEAARFLEERVSLLLKQNGELLNRLITRFHYLGTVSVRRLSGLNEEVDLSLYLDVRFRSVVYTRWPAIARFLIEHRQQIAPLMSLEVAKLITTWLTTTPTQVSDGVPLVFRREFAELALDTARAVQVERAQGTIFLTDEQWFYCAALAGAPDLPTEIGKWALEMAGRRETPDSLKEAIAALHSKRIAEREAKDPSPRQRIRRDRPPAMSFISSRRHLSPWPLGPSRRVERSFRKACLEDSGLRPLMQASPEIAAEVLLALIIEDDPYEEYGDSRMEIDLGLEYADEVYPTAFWKSPFFLFLQIAQRHALDALIKLVNFCTERWTIGYSRIFGTSPPTIELEISHIGAVEFSGNSRVFGWTQKNSLENGALYCALDALERWLTLRLDAGHSIEREVSKLLSECRSAATLGMLINVGKHEPTLLKGPLVCLLTHATLYQWDAERVRDLDLNFDVWSWSRKGEFVFELAKKWIFAPHRKRTLQECAIDLVKSDVAIAALLAEAMRKWKDPDDPKATLELRILKAPLDRANYQEVINEETRERSLTFSWPSALQDDLVAWQSANAKVRALLLIPGQCEEVLSVLGKITDDSAQRLGEIIETAELQDLDKDLISRGLVAAAATLLCSAEKWLNVRPEFRARAISIIMDVVEPIGNDFEAIRAENYGSSSDVLKFAAFAVVHEWAKGGEASSQWESALLRLMTSGSRSTLQVVMSIAYVRRHELGPAWWRLNQVVLFWSALSMIGPRFNDPEGFSPRWAHWLARLRRVPLRKEGATWESLDVERVERGLYKIECRQWARGGEHRRWPRRGSVEELRPSGLNSRYLEVGFSWLIVGAGTGDLVADVELILRFWRTEAERQRQHHKDDGEYALPSQNFGYDLLQKLAVLTLTVETSQARLVWKEVLKHGPYAHYAVRHFVSDIFGQISEGVNGNRFKSTWREIITYALGAGWRKLPGFWFHGERILGDLLGFGFEEALRKLGPDAIAEKRDLYECWSSQHLSIDEDNIDRFARFLTSEVGRTLRLDGLRWIARAMMDNTGDVVYLREAALDTLSELVNVTLVRDSVALRGDPSSRLAVMEITASLVSQNHSAALELQERIKRLK